MSSLKSFYCLVIFGLVFSSPSTQANNKAPSSNSSQWILIDNFEQSQSLVNWLKMDTDNQTVPYVSTPQVTEVRVEKNIENHFLIKKPAAENIVGNRKAISITKLPKPIQVGELYTFYTRIKVEYFPNNHSFGLSNLSAPQIETQNYNAFEPMIRVTDKLESNGYKNDGTLMVMGDNKTYHKIIQPKTNLPAQPLSKDTWYELWYVVNNATEEKNGQSYDLYIRGGEFDEQQKVYEHAKFRMKREQPLLYFMTISNTGSAKKPYGNGGLMYDDIYMAKGLMLTNPAT